MYMYVCLQKATIPHFMGNKDVAVEAVSVHVCMCVCEYWAVATDWCCVSGVWCLIGDWFREDASICGPSGRGSDEEVCTP